MVAKTSEKHVRLLPQDPNAKLRVLLVKGNRADLQSVDEEAQTIRDTLLVRGDVEIQTVDAASLQRVREALKRFQPHCFHCLLYTSPSPRDLSTSRMPSSA